MSPNTDWGAQGEGACKDAACCVSTMQRLHAERPWLPLASSAGIFEFYCRAVIRGWSALGKVAYGNEQILTFKNRTFQSLIAKELTFAILSFVHTVAYQDNAITWFQFETVSFEFCSWNQSQRKISFRRSRSE